MFHQAPISSRNQFGEFLNSMGLKGKAVEVGVHRGEFADVFLRSWQGEVLYGVDPWNVPPGYEDQVATLPDKGMDREVDYKVCMARLEKYGSRFCQVREMSVPASLRFKNGMLDFIHLDGDHRYEVVLNDLRAWWPKLERGGVMALHDWLCPGSVESQLPWARNIQRALSEFLGEMKSPLDVALVVEEGGLPWTAYLVKP